MPLSRHPLQAWPGDLAFDLCIRADQIEGVGVPLVQAMPRMYRSAWTIPGNPDIAGSGLDPWRAYITEIANSTTVS